MGCVPNYKVCPTPKQSLFILKRLNLDENIFLQGTEPIVAARLTAELSIVMSSISVSQLGFAQGGAVLQ